MKTLPVIKHVDGHPVVELSFVGGPQDGLVLPVSFDAWGDAGLVDWKFGEPGGDVTHRYLSLDDYEPGITATLTMEYAGSKRNKKKYA